MKPGCVPMTQRQSNNQWSGGEAAHPAPPQKIPSAKIRWKSSLRGEFTKGVLFLHDNPPAYRTRAT